MTKGLSQKHIAFLEARGLDIEIVVRNGVHTGRRLPDTGKVAPHLGGDVLVFPYFERGSVVNEKYRAPGKKFWQTEGGRRTFYGSDILDDTVLELGHEALIITEGELDKIAAEQCGHQYVVSVPDGATLPPKNREERERDDDDSTGKFEFMFNNKDRLKKIRRFIIATDGDAAGRHLASELVRRLNPAKCSFIEYPDGTKDINDVLSKFGKAAVTKMLEEAKPYPVKGLFRLRDFPEVAPIDGYQTGISTLDTIFRPFLGELCFVIGIPGHGKSALIANLLANWADIYGWTSVVFSPEEPVSPWMRDKFRRIWARGDVLPIEVDRIEALDGIINDKIVWIAADPMGDDQEDFTLEWLIEKATEAVLRFGIKVFVIDPWNEIEHSRERGETGTEYIGRALRMLNRFRHAYGVMVIVMLHPTKDIGKDGKSRPPSPYDADGSAMFYNKADHFITVFRPDEDLDQTAVRMAKVKFSGTGKKGSVMLSFDRASGRYDTLDSKDPPEVTTGRLSDMMPAQKVFELKAENVIEFKGPQK